MPESFDCPGPPLGGDFPLITAQLAGPAEPSVRCRCGLDLPAEFVAADHLSCVICKPEDPTP
jgi:hypothetical protein